MILFFAKNLKIHMNLQRKINLHKLDAILLLYANLTIKVNDNFCQTNPLSNCEMGI
jgi:hypothetical protein